MSASRDPTRPAHASATWRESSLHRKSAAQDPSVLQPLDRQVDVVGAEIGEAAALEVRAAWRLALAVVPNLIRRFWHQNANHWRAVTRPGWGAPVIITAPGDFCCHFGLPGVCRLCVPTTVGRQTTAPSPRGGRNCLAVGAVQEGRGRCHGGPTLRKISPNGLPTAKPPNWREPSVGCAGPVLSADNFAEASAWLEAA